MGLELSLNVPVATLAEAESIIQLVDRPGVNFSIHRFAPPTSACPPETNTSPSSPTSTSCSETPEPPKKRGRGRPRKSESPAPIPSVELPPPCTAPESATQTTGTASPPAPNATTSAAPTSPAPSDSPAPPLPTATTLSKEDVIKFLQKKLDELKGGPTDGVSAIRNVLQQCGGKSISEVPPENYQRVIDMVGLL